MKQFVYGLLLTTAVISCSRDGEPVQIDNTPLVPVQVQNRIYTYTEGNKLETITSNYGRGTYTFKYEGDLIKSIDNTIFEYDSQQRLTRAYTTDGKKEIKYIYKDNGQAESISTEKFSSNRYTNGIYQTYDIIDTTHLVYSIEDSNVLEATGKSWENTPSGTYGNVDTPYSIKIWLEQDKNENFAKNIKGLDKINLYLIGERMFESIGILGNKNNTIHTEYIYRGYSGLPYEGSGYLIEYVYDEKNIAVGFKDVLIIFDETRQGKKGQRGRVLDPILPIKYNRQP